MENFNLPKVIWHAVHQFGDVVPDEYYQFRFYKSIATSRVFAIDMTHMSNLVVFLEDIDNMVHVYVKRGIVELTFTSQDDATRFALEFM